MPSRSATRSWPTSGVSIDDETIKMMSYQEDYQATAHYISTLESLLQLLTQI